MKEILLARFMDLRFMIFVILIMKDSNVETNCFENIEILIFRFTNFKLNIFKLLNL